METSQVPSISELLADDSIDHFGAPIAVDYSKLWETKASANRNLFGKLSEDDVDTIHRVIAAAAVNWEMTHGTIYVHPKGPIDDGHPGLRGAKVVPVMLNLPAGESMGSFAADKALRNHDFIALSRTGLPDGARPQDLIRWRPYDSHWQHIRSFPSYHIVWEDPDSKELYAQIPKPLEGMNRGGCDHCRIHNPARAGELVDNFDDRRHVNKMRSMSAGDTAITPFSLCRFHWWYVWSGELLRPSQVHALELLVSGDLLKRWKISHTRDFLVFMRAQLPDADELLADDLAGSGPPGPGPAQGAWENTVGGAILEALGISNSSNAQGATVASTDADQSVPGGQAASATTVDGPDDTEASDQNTVQPASPGLTDAHMIILQPYHIKSRIEQEASNTGNFRSPRQEWRQALFNMPMSASRRHGVSLPKATSFLDGSSTPMSAQENNGLASHRANGDSQTMGGSGASSSATNSVPAPESSGTYTVGPAEPPQMNGQSTPAFQATGPIASSSKSAYILPGTNGATASQANGHIPSSTMAAVPHPQTNGTPAQGNDGFLAPPPKGPRLWVEEQARQARAGNSAHDSERSRTVVLPLRPKKEA